jgi:multiple sugar transport system substrate-binding protein
VTYRGLTWDHPRGYRALEAAAAEVGNQFGRPLLQWHRQPLEGFESRPIEELAADYDLLVIDHPHVGEAVARGCLRPLEDLFTTTDIAGWQARMIGQATVSYRWDGRHWALPLDVATQVMASRPDLLDGPLPQTWDEVVDVAGRRPVAVAVAGPHAWVTMLAICAALGEAIFGPDLLPAATWTEAWRILAYLFKRAPAGTQALNPIGLLEAMASGDGIALIPLVVYGYVTYAIAAPPRRPVAFDDAPTARPGGPRGSALGGTGIAITRRARASSELRDHLLWLLSDAAQTDFIPRHGGQPAARAAWQDEAVNALWGGFYRRTAATVETAIVRPRHAGYVGFQDRASAVVREGLRDSAAAGLVLDRLREAWRASLAGGGASDATLGAQAQR